MKVRIERIKNEWFVDIEVAKNSWKNHVVCKSQDEAMRHIEKLRANWGAELITA